MNDANATAAQHEPILLFDGKCAVCRHIGGWVAASVKGKPGTSRLIVRPIGDDPQALRLLNPNLDIWDAYATIHLAYAGRLDEARRRRRCRSPA